MSRRAGFAALAALAFGALAAGGCSPKKVVGANAPPETYAFIQAPVDSISPVNHRIHLYWYGTDPDGEVVAYEFRMIAGGGPADPPWVRLPAATTDSLFTVFTGDSAQVTPTFEFRAVDDDGAVDESPARQTFRLNNVEPVVTIVNKLAVNDSTYGSVTFSWDVNDPDGGGPGLRYYIWLNGNPGGLDSTADRTFTVPTARFLEDGPGGPRFNSGHRTLYIRAVDDGGRTGPVDSMRWYVRAPAALQRNQRGRVLLIDDASSTSGSNGAFDAFFTAGLAGTSTRLLADSGSVLRPQFNPGMFRSPRDFAQTLRQFEAVVWYRGLENSVSALLQAHQDSLFAWLETGGRLYLDGPYLIQGRRTPGAIRESFVTSHLASDGLITFFSSGIQDSTAGWNNRGGSRLRSSRYAAQITTAAVVPTIPGETGGLRAFAVRDTADVALWALPGQLEPANVGFEAPVGIRVNHAGDGRLVLLAVPLRTAVPAQSNPVLQSILRDVLRP